MVDWMDYSIDVKEAFPEVLRGLWDTELNGASMRCRCPLLAAHAPLPRHYEWCSEVVRCRPRAEVVMSRPAANHIISFQPRSPTSWPKLLTRRVPSTLTLFPSAYSSFLRSDPSASSCNESTQRDGLRSKNSLEAPHRPGVLHRLVIMDPTLGIFSSVARFLHFPAYVV